MADRFPTTLRRAIALLLVPALSNCTLVGGLAGAAIDSKTPPSYQNWPAEERWRLAPGDNVRLYMADGGRVEGKYLGAVGPTGADSEVYLLIEGDLEVPVSEVRRIDIQTSKTGWVLGGMLGLLVDGAVVAMVCANARSFSGGWWSGSGRLGH